MTNIIIIILIITKSEAHSELKKSIKRFKTQICCRATRPPNAKLTSKMVGMHNIILIGKKIAN